MAILLVLSIAMVIGGLYVLAAELFWTPVIYGVFIMGGVSLVTVGSYLLWENFLAPILGDRDQ